MGGLLGGTGPKTLLGVFALAKGAVGDALQEARVLEIESNPLPICTRPQVLRSARRT
ncbi:MAG: hypothetical protein Q8O82_14305 [Pseudorhodobacter sp.]|nr:hypothetical protein [Pseudorhodobacter sp.]